MLFALGCPVLCSKEGRKVKQHPKLDNVEMQEKKMRVHKVTIKNGGQNNRQRMLNELRKTTAEHVLRSGEKNPLYISELHILICNWFLLLFLKKSTAQDDVDLILFQTMKKTIPNYLKRICEHTTPIKTRPNKDQHIQTQNLQSNSASDKILPLPLFQR